MYLCFVVRKTTNSAHSESALFLTVCCGFELFAQKICKLLLLVTCTAVGGRARVVCGAEPDALECLLQFSTQSASGANNVQRGRFICFANHGGQNGTRLPHNRRRGEAPGGTGRISKINVLFIGIAKVALINYVRTINCALCVGVFVGALQLMTSYWPHETHKEAR